MPKQLQNAYLTRTVTHISKKFKGSGLLQEILKSSLDRPNSYIFQLLAKMANEYVSVHLFLRAVNTVTHDQCAQVKGHGEEGADLKWGPAMLSD